MARDQIDVLLRIRRVAEDEAKRVYAARLAEEAEARSRVEKAEERILHERQRASDTAQGDGAVEAYITWLPIARRDAEAAEAAYENAVAAVTVARAALTVAHGAAEATDKFIQHRAQEEALAEARKDQAKMDEVAARRKPTTE